MFIWRNALILGIGFIIVGIAYYFLQGDAAGVIDRAGATMLVVLGAAMAFVFTILLRGSRGL